MTAELGTWAGAIGAADPRGGGRDGRGSATSPGPPHADRWPAVTDAAYQPQYRQIEQVLRERIAALRPGERLPSDAELCAEFGVSRMTARNAMQRLAADGLVARAAGSRQLRRRSASASPRQPADDVHPGDAPTRPRAELADADPGDPSVDHGRGGQPGDPAAPAGRPPAPPALRRRGADGDRIDRAPGSCADAVMTADLARGSLHETLGRAGIVAPARDGHDRRGRRHGRGCPPARRSGPATRCSSSDGSSPTATAARSRRPSRATPPTATPSAIAFEVEAPDRARRAGAMSREVDERPRSPRPRRPGRARPDRDRGRLDRGDRASSRSTPDRRRTTGAPATEDLPYIAPGFVDVHVHGGGGHDAMGGADALDGMARHLLRRGVTGFLPTAVTAPLPALATFAETVRAWLPDAPVDGAEPLGFNLEGPFLAEARRGAHDPTFLRAPGRRRSARPGAAPRRPAPDHGRAGAAGRPRADRLAPRARRRDLDGPLGLDRRRGARRLRGRRPLHDPPVQRDERHRPPGARPGRRRARWTTPPTSS